MAGMTEFEPATPFTSSPKIASREPLSDGTDGKRRSEQVGMLQALYERVVAPPAVTGEPHEAAWRTAADVVAPVSDQKFDASRTPPARSEPAFVPMHVARDAIVGIDVMLLGQRRTIFAMSMVTPNVSVTTVRYSETAEIGRFLFLNRSPASFPGRSRL